MFGKLRQLDKFQAVSYIYEKIWQIEIQYILGKTDIKANYDTILYQEHDEFDKLKKDIKNKIDDKL